MSLFTKRPFRLGGAVLSSGSVDTGQLLNTFGGGQCSTWSQSGIGADLVIQSGPGRLDVVQLTTYFRSGTGVIFYDSNVATSGGPFSASGHKIVGLIPPAVNAGVGFVSGTVTGVLPWTGEPYRPGMPFFSGLCASPWPAGSAASGTHGFTVSYTVQTIVSGSAVETV